MSAPAPDGGTVITVPYHRLYRAQPEYRWWRPLVAVVVLAVLVLAVSVAVSAGFLIVGAIVGEVDILAIATDPEAFARIDTTSPFHLLFALVSVAVWLPCVPVALFAAGIRPAGFRTGIVHSVAFRLRFGWFARCLVPAVVVTAVSIGGGLAIAVLAGEPLAPFTTPLPAFLAALVIILLVVPFQAAAEEYVFRGVLLQAIGAWARWLPVGGIVSTALFASLHLYDVWGILDVALFAVAAVIVTWRTGGLEAAIALHVVNNVVAFALLASGVLGTTHVESDGGSPGALGLSALTMAAYVLWVERMARRRGMARIAHVHVPGMPGAVSG